MSPYPNLMSDENKRILKDIEEFARLQHEYGAIGIEPIIQGLNEKLRDTLRKIKSLPLDEAMKKAEPDDLAGIKALRTEGPRMLWKDFDEAVYREKLEGAMLARFAGCTLGAIVEFWTVEEMKNWAEYIGDNFPPTDYWSAAKDPSRKRYRQSRCIEYTRGNINGVPVDDDIVYTLLGLLIAEDFGLGFTTEDAGKAWVRYLPHACTAEAIALENLQNGMNANEAAEESNPYVQWIGADIRSDPFGYLAPGCPEKAAAMAYYDAYLSHRRSGIYGEMFFSAAIAAAFSAATAEEALRIGLTEIPKECMLYTDIVWALENAPSVHDYKEAVQAVEERFKGMSGVHTNLNACLTVFGLLIGGKDVTKVISEIVAMGYDNDCTAATAGSIVGAIVGKSGIPEHWHKDFNNKVYSYLNEYPEFQIDDLLNRFTALAKKNF